LSALHIEAEILEIHTQSPQVVRRLIGYFGTDSVNLRSAAGAVPLHYAIRNLNVHVVEALLQAQADLDVRDPFGNTFLELARLNLLAIAEDVLEGKISQI
jgi:ankyrin repeat protein